MTDWSSRQNGLLEARFHGRGGMGAVVASQLLAHAAFLEGRWVQSFPFFGVERRGAPVTAFARISSSPVEERTNIYEPDIVIVLDPSLLRAADCLSGLKPGGSVVANAASADIPWTGPVYLVDATGLALEEGLGSRALPLVNTAMIGALAGATKVVALDSVLRSIDALVPQKRDANRRAAERAYREVRRVSG